MCPIIAFVDIKIAIDSLTTKGKITNSISTAAFTPSLGIVYDHEGFQIGLFTGMDFCVNGLARQWVYQNKPWLSLGFGFSLFSKNKLNNNASKAEQPPN